MDFKTLIDFVEICNLLNVSSPPTVLQVSKKKKLFELRYFDEILENWFVRHFTKMNYTFCDRL